MRSAAGWAIQQAGAGRAIVTIKEHQTASIDGQPDQAAAIM
jgi:hypothetical protein